MPTYANCSVCGRRYTCHVSVGQGDHGGRVEGDGTFRRPRVHNEPGSRKRCPGSWEDVDWDTIEYKPTVREAKRDYIAGLR